MAQKVQAQPTTLGGTRDQAGDVGNGVGVLTGGHHAEVGHQRGEWVVGDFRLGRRDRRHQGRLTRRGEADQSDVGDGLEFQGQVAGLALLPEKGESGCLSRPGSQCGVT